MLLAGALAFAGVAVLAYGIVVAAQGLSIMGQRFSLLAYLGLGYWAALAGLVVACVGAYASFRPLPTHGGPTTSGAS